MNKKLYIHEPQVIRDELNGTVRLSALLEEEGREPYEAWYEFDIQYAPYLCYEKSDAFVVFLLPYAMKNGIDLYCKGAMSERLHYQLTQYLIPSINDHTHTYNKIDIYATLSDERFPSQNAVGASVSGGVDSFYTLLNHNNRPHKNYLITHLTFFNVGSNGDHGGEEARELFRKRVALVSKIADETNLPMVCVDSNMSEYISMTHVSCHTCRTLSVVLAMQKLFSRYLFASGYSYDKFEIGEKGFATFDLLVLQCLCTENVTFQLSGAEKERLGKIEFISDYPITYSHLNVCVRDGENCSQCSKCSKTMLGLYIAGKLDRYAAVFDVKSFYENIDLYIVDACLRKRQTDYGEIYQYLKDNHRIKFKHKWKVFFLKVRAVLSRLRQLFR